MIEDNLSVIQKKWHGTGGGYLIGLILSLLLTSISFYLAYSHPLKGNYLIFILVGLGILQAIAQILFFLHVGKEARPRWETLLFLFMALILIIVVLGTLWIMKDLDQRVMSDMKSNQELHHD